ncbi:MAG TPA: hypothetical protein VHR66_30435 [Gemmataceae bacterium]|jgi:hypothetical protein|nr:hypothetical protein [Gemmataceae bacterium]
MKTFFTRLVARTTLSNGPRKLIRSTLSFETLEPRWAPAAISGIVLVSPPPTGGIAAHFVDEDILTGAGTGAGGHVRA